jgi:hypothetical protein
MISNSAVSNSKPKNALTTNGGEASTTVNTPEGYRLPDNNTLQHAAKLAIVDDKPIIMDYWTYSLEKTALIGVKENQEKLLVKSEEEYTSPIIKIISSPHPKFLYISSHS